mgnify:CR=1 FL=1
MKKILSIALIFAIIFSFTVAAMAAGGVTLRKTSDSWYIDVANGYIGNVTYQDNKGTYSTFVNGNGKLLCRSSERFYRSAHLSWVLRDG